MQSPRDGGQAAEREESSPAQAALGALKHAPKHAPTSGLPCHLVAAGDNSKEIDAQEKPRSEEGLSGLYDMACLPMAPPGPEYVQTKKWRPQRDLNPRRQRERLVS